MLLPAIGEVCPFINIRLLSTIKPGILLLRGVNVAEFFIFWTENFSFLCPALIGDLRGS